MGKRPRRRFPLSKEGQNRQGYRDSKQMKPGDFTAGGFFATRLHDHRARPHPHHAAECWGEGGRSSYTQIRTGVNLFVLFKKAINSTSSGSG